MRGGFQRQFFKVDLGRSAAPIVIPEFDGGEGNYVEVTNVFCVCYMSCFLIEHFIRDRWGILQAYVPSRRQRGALNGAVVTRTETTLSREYSRL